MKVYKKTAFLLIIAALAIVLVACGGNNKDDKKTEKQKQNNTVHIADILNGKENRQIIVAEKTDNTETPQVRWAGFIGNGKLDAHPYYQNDELEISQIRNLNKKDFNTVIKSEDQNYKTYDKDGNKLEISYGERKASLDFKLNDSNDVRGFLFDINTNKLGNDNDKASVVGLFYAVPKNKDNGWLVMETEEKTDINGDVITPKRLYIKAKKGEERIDISNAEKYTKKYDNVKITE